MLSRVADSLYWLNRYIERAENVARFIDVNHHLILDAPMSFESQWQPLVSITGDHEDFKARYGSATRESVTHFLTFDKENANSIISSVYAARENARTIREIISSEMWEQLNLLYLMVRDAGKRTLEENSNAEFLKSVRQAAQLFYGITDMTVSRDEGWHFGRIGRMMERADKTSRILDVKYFILLPKVDYVGTPMDSLQWAAVLASTSGLEAYRQAYHGISPEQVVEFLVLNRDFPRAMHHCLIFAEDSLHTITGTPMACYSNPAEQMLGKIRSELDFADVEEIIKGGLHEYLDKFQSKLIDATTAIGTTFFGYPEPVEETDDHPLQVQTPNHIA